MLKDKVAEHLYLQDVVTEKKTQVDFLQNQLEDRIKLYYQLENQNSKLQEQLDETACQYQEATRQNNNLQKELLCQREEADRLQVVRCALEEKVQEKESVVVKKDDHIHRLEEALQASYQNESSLQISLSEAQKKIDSLQRQFDINREESLLKRGITTASLSFHKMERDFLPFVMNYENRPSPVIALATSYEQKTSKGTAAN